MQSSNRVAAQWFARRTRNTCARSHLWHDSCSLLLSALQFVVGRSLARTSDRPTNRPSRRPLATSRTNVRHTDLTQTYLPAQLHTDSLTSRSSAVLQICSWAARSGRRPSERAVCCARAPLRWIIYKAADWQSTCCALAARSALSQRVCSPSSIGVRCCFGPSSCLCVCLCARE